MVCRYIENPPTDRVLLKSGRAAMLQRSCSKHGIVLPRTHTK